LSQGLDSLDPDLRQGCLELQQLCSSNGLQTRITSTVRTYAQQKYLWDRYQAGNSSLPAAPPLHSAHEYGWAFDMVVTPYEYQQVVGGWWETYWGGTHGGKSDPVHFELPGAGKAAYQLGEQSQPAPVEKTTFAEGAYDFALGMFPGYSTVQLVATILQLVPGLKQATVLDWLANPHKYPKKLVLLQELLGIL
jgi:hypothetical protein